MIFKGVFFLIAFGNHIFLIHKKDFRQHFINIKKDYNIIFSTLNIN